MMRRMIIGLSAAALTVAALVALTPALISSETVKTQIAAQISAWTGAPVRLEGEPTVTLFPDLTVKLRGVTVAGAGGGDAPALVTMDALRGSLRLLPLLGGRLEVSEFTMTRPRITLAVAADGSGNWQYADGTVARGLKAGEGLSADVRLGTFVIEDGSVAFDDARSGRHDEASGLDLTIDWPALKRGGAAAGSFLWHGETVETSIAAGNPLAFFSGQQSDLRLAVAAPPLQLNFDGAANQVADLQLDGNVEIKSPSVRRLLDWMGVAIGPGASLGPLAVTSKVNVVGWSASLAGTSIELDGNRADGALAVKPGETRPLVQGTLAFDSLDLSAYGGALGVRAPDNGDGAADATIPADAFGIVDVDLRVSAGQVLLGKVKLGRSALSAVMRDKRLALEVGDTALYGGRGEGSISLAARGEEVDGRATVKLDGVNLGAMLPDLIDSAALEGEASLVADVAGRGTTYRGLLETLSGTASGEIASGALVGTDIVGLIATIFDKPAPAGAIEGRTPFDRADFKTTIAGGVADVDKFAVVSPVLGIDIGGRTDIAAEAFDLSGTATIHEAPKTTDTLHGPAIAELPFRIVGGWTTPLVLPDVGVLSR